jgi:TadE-like protein
MNHAHFRNFLQNDRGVAAIEFVLIFPIMLFLFFGLIDFTGYVSYNRKISAVAGATADLVSQHRTSIVLNAVGSNDDIADYFNVSGMILNPQSDSDVRIQLYGYRMEGTTLTKKWQVNNGSVVECAKPPPTSDMPNLMEANNDLIIAHVCATYTPYIGTFTYGSTMGGASFKIEEFVIQRPRSTTKLDCFMTTVGGTKCPAA